MFPVTSIIKVLPVERSIGSAAPANVKFTAGVRKLAPAGPKRPIGPYGPSKPWSTKKVQSAFGGAGFGPGADVALTHT